MAGGAAGEAAAANHGRIAKESAALAAVKDVCGNIVPDDMILDILAGACRVASRRIASRRAVSCRAVSCRVASCRVVSCRAVSCRAVPCRAVPYSVAMRCVALCSVALKCVMSVMSGVV